MKKGMKAIAALGLSSILLASTASPAATFAKTSSGIERFDTASFLKTKTTESQKKVLVSEDSFIIKFSKPLTAAEHNVAGGTLVRQVSNLNYAEIKVKNKKNLAQVMKKYQKLTKVVSVSPSALFTTSSLGDPKANLQYQHTMLQTEKVLKLAGKNKVTVAVIDTGVDAKHPDLKKNLLPGYNAANPANQPLAMHHGTHVSGIIAAEKGNGVGGYGISPNVKILPIDVFDGGFGASDASIAEGILYAVNKGAKVINMSLGGYGTSPVLEDAVKTAIKKGVVVVAASGNESWDMVSTPAGYEGVISVGSINKDKKLSDYSNYGPSVDVVAPGEEVYSTLYDTEKKSTYYNLSGTSMASPVVAAVASLLLTKYPNLTPAQVEYILEKSADDLGPAGFDTKFANGLINPAKALSFNMKNLPSYVKQEWTKKEILAKAEQVKTDKVVKEEAITKAYEQKWIQLQVKKGDHIQTLLEGAKQYDYKMIGHFYGADNKTESFDVNRTQDGSVEAEMVTAPFDATLVIGVKDVNGSFDDSSKKASKYKLTVEKVSELPKDESSVEKMTSIPKLPYKLPAPFTLAGENGDYDYFTFKATEEQLVKIALSGIPGLNTEISVYQSSNLIPEDSEPMTAEQKLAMLKELLEGKEQAGPDFYANNNGSGKGETLAFTTEPGQEYIIKIAGDAYDYVDFFSLLMGLGELQSKEKPSSLLPYSLSVEGKTLPDDEDGLNQGIFGDSSEESDNILMSLNKGVKIASDDPYVEEQTRITNQIVESALPYSIGDKALGYIQNDMDLDFFLVEPQETAIYEFGIKNSEGVIPQVSVQEVVEDKDEDGAPYSYLNSLSENVDWSGWDPVMKDKFVAGLKKGKKYVVQVSPNTYSGGSSISFDPYELSSKKLISNPEDKYEPSDLKNVVKLPSTSFNANLAMPGDIDAYYFKSTETGIKSVTTGVAEANAAQKKKYPSEMISQYHALATVIEDTNGNGKLDLDKDTMVTSPIRGFFEQISVSFKAQKNKGYFIVVEPSFPGYESFSLLPYTLKVVNMNKKDEISSQAKPILMKKSKGEFVGRGYFNAGITGGDVDWYQFELAKNSTGTIKLETDKVNDGVISIYQNGKLVKQSDSYLMGDTEELQLTLKKGKYQVKVSDYYGTSSVSAYTLKVNMK